MIVFRRFAKVRKTMFAASTIYRGTAFCIGKGRIFACVPWRHPRRKAVGECPAAVAVGAFCGGSLYRQERTLFRFCMRRPHVSESRRRVSGGCGGRRLLRRFIVQTGAGIFSLLHGAAGRVEKSPKYPPRSAEFSLHLCINNGMIKAESSLCLFAVRNDGIRIRRQIRFALLCGMATPTSPFPAIPSGQKSSVLPAAAAWQTALLLFPLFRPVKNRLFCPPRWPDKPHFPPSPFCPAENPVRFPGRNNSCSSFLAAFCPFPGFPPDESSRCNFPCISACPGAKTRSDPKKG